MDSVNLFVRSILYTNFLMKVVRPTPNRVRHNALMARMSACPSVCLVPDPKSRTEGLHGDNQVPVPVVLSVLLARFRFTNTKRFF